MALTQLRDAIESQVLEFAWNQWTQLGVLGVSSRRDNWAMDPEALLVLTAEVGRYDPRLFDEVLDWCALNGRLLSLQRVSNLTRQYPVDRELVRAVLVWTRRANPSLTWLTDWERPDTQPKPLFPPDRSSFIRETDPAFESRGYLKPLTERSGKSVQPDLKIPANLGFKLRLAFGVGARAELMRLLLAANGRGLSASVLTEDAGFTRRNVHETLSALVESGVVKSRLAGKERVYLIYPNKWADALEVLGVLGIPQRVRWVPLLNAIATVFVWTHRTDFPESHYLLSSEARDLVERVIPLLEGVGLEIDLGPSPASMSLEDVERLIQQLLEVIASKRLTQE